MKEQRDIVTLAPDLDRGVGGTRAPLTGRGVVWKSSDSLSDGADRAERIDVVELAHDLAKIASATSEPAIGRQLMEVVNRILKAAGLPPGVA